LKKNTVIKQMLKGKNNGKKTQVLN